MIELRSVEGQMQKRIGNMGDAAAIVVTRILAGDEPPPLDIDMVLTVLDLSFADPSAVATVRRRPPERSGVRENVVGSEGSAEEKAFCYNKGDGSVRLFVLSICC